MTVSFWDEKAAVRFKLMQGTLAAVLNYTYVRSLNVLTTTTFAMVLVRDNARPREHAQR
jgi:hypothetical protein